MAALHLLAAQSTQVARAANAVPTRSAAAISPAPPTYPGMSLPVYPYIQRERPHPLLSGSLRRGKWTSEEEEYAAAIIQHFVAGVLPIQYGTTLRGYIAQLLHCDPMRVSKKLIPGSMFVGVRIDPKIGRRSYYPCPVDTPRLEEHKERAERHLAQLRSSFIESIEREEQPDQAMTSPQHGSPSYSAQVLSPLKRKRSEGDKISPLVMLHEPLNRTKSLPSLLEVMRKNRLRAPSPPSREPALQTGAFRYASPRHSNWYEEQSVSSRLPASGFNHQPHALPPLRSALYPAPP